METLSYCQLMERCLAAEARVVELAAENVVLKTFCKNAAFDADYEAELGMERGGFTDALNNIETPATDRIVAESKARGVEKFAKYIALYNSDAEWHAVNFAKQLRVEAEHGN
jgi:hypothetical protein|nr:MAG TPA: hypothetical protein [Caudoviricetes sp.]